MVSISRSEAPGMVSIRRSEVPGMVRFDLSMGPPRPRRARSAAATARSSGRVRRWTGWPCRSAQQSRGPIRCPCPWASVGCTTGPCRLRPGWAPSQAMPSQAIPSQAMPSQAMPSQVIPRAMLPAAGMCATPRAACQVKSCHVKIMPCQVLPRQVMPRQVMPRQVMPRHLHAAGCLPAAETYATCSTHGAAPSARRAH
jgi:hypothetical protein